MTRFSMRMPYAPSRYNPGSFEQTMPGSSGVWFSGRKPCGPSCTLRKWPTPCPEPCQYVRPCRHNACRANISTCAPVAPCGNCAVASAIWDCKTRVKSSFCRAVGGESAIVRVMSVVPSRYCAPESTSSRPLRVMGSAVSGDAS